MRSKITDKFQITIPKKVRERLKLTRHDAIEWEFEDDRVVVRPSKRPFMDLMGSIKTGTGDVKKDIQSARKSIAGRYK
ncbi:MAG TPA: AbrB/MazE/SpoVT family DNA-binding domain-containing protein [Spirochaetota bacterium]|nr:AbrB/MazE/SpoVT family DNA-binding domain-containing protein [Spirochaetota bacterium]HRZ26960.1 AbrB/MazE/SpoVT family DNA-binding domain-containing protein [Spirochaetota bacterium]HSA15979.1 AbrB/MazE/SpoVT family DNA-binding domain-containing protein [Spirochaetota bacterium]